MRHSTTSSRRIDLLAASCSRHAVALVLFLLLVAVQDAQAGWGTPRRSHRAAFQPIKKTSSSTSTLSAVGRPMQEAAAAPTNRNNNNKVQDDTTSTSTASEEEQLALLVVGDAPATFMAEDAGCFGFF